MDIIQDNILNRNILIQNTLNIQLKKANIDYNINNNSYKSKIYYLKVYFLLSYMDYSIISAYRKIIQL